MHFCPKTKQKYLLVQPKNICLKILKNRRKKEFGEWDGNPISYKNLKRLIPKLKETELKKLVKKNILLQEEDKRYELAHTKNSAGIFGVYRVFLPQSEVFATITATENANVTGPLTVASNKTITVNDGGRLVIL